MTNLRANSIKNESGTDGPIFGDNLNFTGTSHVVLPKGTTAQRPSGVAIGSIRFNTSTKVLEQYNGSSWVTLASESSTSNRGVFGGGYDFWPNFENRISYVYVQSSGPLSEEAYFGDLSNRSAFYASHNCASSTRGIFPGTYNDSTGGAYNTNTIEYVTIAVKGNATDFGDLYVARHACASCSSSTRGIFGGGTTYSPAATGANTMDYITIASTGNALYFGDFLEGGRSYTGGLSSTTRGIFAGGTTVPNTGRLNIINYVTIASTGNATDFGDLSATRSESASVSSNTRGVFMSGVTDNAYDYNRSSTRTSEYVTIASTGTAVFFGFLQKYRAGGCGLSSKIRGVTLGTNYGTYRTSNDPALLDVVNTWNSVEYVTIATQGDSVDFGHMSRRIGYCGSFTNSHGGL